MNRRERLLALVALGSLALFLSPILATPFLEDDVFNSFIDGWLGYEHLDLAHGLGSLFVATNLGNGRFYPVFPLLLLGEFHFVHAASVLKALVLLAVLLNAATLWWLLRPLAPALATPMLALLPAVFQLRRFYDPIVGFSLHMQLALEFALLGFIGLAWSGLRRNRVWLGCGLVAYALGCLTYEACYAYVFAAPVVARRAFASSRARTVGTVLFVAVPVICACVAIDLRVTNPVPLAAQYIPNFAPPAMLATFVRQALAAVPLSYVAFDPSGIFGGLGSLWAQAGFAGIVAALIAGTLTGYAAGRGPAGGARFGLVLGLVLALAPALAIVASPRWQQDLLFGLGYTPVYLQYFGVAVLLAALADLLLRRFPFALARIALGCAVALVAGTTYGANAIVIARYGDYFGATLLPDSLDAGLLADAPDGAQLFVDASYPANVPGPNATWDPKYFYYYHTGKRFQLRTIDRLALADAKRPGYVVLSAPAGGTRGTAVAALLMPETRVAGSGPATVRRGEQFTDTATVYRSDGVEATLVRLRSTCGPVAVESLLSGNPSGVLLSFGAGFYPEERDVRSRWRWASAASSVALWNPSSRARRVQLSFALRPASDSATRAIVGWPAGSETSALEHGVDAHFSREFELQPGASLTIPLAVDGVAIHPRHDPRSLLFQVRDATLVEPACAGSERDVPPATRKSGS